MEFNQKLDNYAEIILSYGANIQPEQNVLISGEVIHREFLLLLAQKAYEKKAKYVEVELFDPRLSRFRIQNSTEDNLSFVPSFLTEKYKELVDEHWARVVILGSEFPDILSDLNPKLTNIPERARWKAVKYYFDEGIGKSKIHWTLAAASTPEWAKKVFPSETNLEKAQSLLWNQIFSICRADSSDFASRWKKHFESLKERQESLNLKKIKTLHFSGPGTQLDVSLSEHARFQGGPDIGPFGVYFEPNIPTEECFTTPDYRLTNGFVRATRPFMINGKLIKGLELKFEDGNITEFSANEGQETFKEYINTDEGAKRLGEVALVGIDSPIFESGLIFEEILYDENAACHIAVGSSYTFCIDGGKEMTKEQLNALGCNDSVVHTDIMISNESTKVTATTYLGEEILLIEDGKWVNF
ncbi:MAG: aminopeptidase [Bdellovibrionales bacterium]|nr:aminopeptidase [Bdellovibrionales bacterium]